MSLRYSCSAVLVSLYQLTVYRTLESAQARKRYEAHILSKSRYEPRLRATPRKRVVYEPRALSSAPDRL